MSSATGSFAYVGGLGIAGMMPGISLLNRGHARHPERRHHGRGRRLTPQGDHRKNPTL